MQNGNVSTFADVLFMYIHGKQRQGTDFLIQISIIKGTLNFCTTYMHMFGLVKVKKRITNKLNIQE